MDFKHALTLLAVVCQTFLTSSCSSTPPSGFALAAYQAYDLPVKLPTSPENVRILVSLKTQRTYIVEGKKILMTMPVSIGAPDTPTPTGNFFITHKKSTKRSATQGYAYRGSNSKKSMIHRTPPGWSFIGTPMPYWCRFKPGFGFHTGWIRHHPCTDGCIRMHQNLAPKFFRLVSIGTPVNIAYSQPLDFTTPKISLPPDSGPLPDYPNSTYLTDRYFKLHR